MACKVTTLAHESWNNSVKAGTLITKSFLSSAQSTKIFCCLWDLVCKQLKGDAAQGLAVDGKSVLTWKSQTSYRFMVNKFRAAHPDLCEEFTEPSRYRVMRVTKAGLKLIETTPIPEGETTDV